MAKTSDTKPLPLPGSDLHQKAIETFLNKGGEIRRIPRGVSGHDTATHKWSGFQPTEKDLPTPSDPVEVSAPEPKIQIVDVYGVD